MALGSRGMWSNPDEELIANAFDDAFDLSPVSQAPAIQTRANWAALLPGQEIPLIGEPTYGRDPEDDDDR